MTKKEEQKEDYLGVAPINSIIKKMKKEYDKDPVDWRVIGARDKQGNNDMFISKKPNTYWLKSKQLSPYSALTMGSTIRNIDKDIDEKIGKEISTDEMLRIFGMIVPIKKSKSVIASGIEKYSQKEGNYLKKIIKERDPNISFHLARRVDEEFTKKYPQRRGLYI